MYVCMYVCMYAFHLRPRGSNVTVAVRLIVVFGQCVPCTAPLC